MKLYFETRASKRVIITSVALYLISVVVLTYSDMQINKVAPGVPKPDLVFGYDYENIQSIFTEFGEDGRKAYSINLIIDSFMPVFFGFASLFLIAGTFPKYFKLLSIAPSTFMILDIIENFAFGIMLWQYPGISETFVSVMSPVTQIKLASFVIALPTFIILLLVFIYYQFKANET